MYRNEKTHPEGCDSISLFRIENYIRIQIIKAKDRLILF